MAALPPPASETVKLPLVGREFVFRRLTWRDEVAFALEHPGASRLDYVATALVAVDGKSVTTTQAHTILAALPRPIALRVVIFYMGSLPDRRLLTVDLPYVAPEPSVYQGTVDQEAEELESREDELLERQFGAEEVAESKALAVQMARGTNFAGVTRSLADEPVETPAPTDPFDGMDEEPPRYHAVVT